ncbi:MAG: UDP-N-acetylmuramoyl-tripeptide--D-alanyl-D-alanine ligase [Parachlamydiales bacterium]|nr:UDP-N-acetylmuramoyl-tripeptide--D-alanyl-D-alanine ligase [Parachlamydiales bacterium]
MRGVLVRDIARHLGVFCESELQISGYQVDSRLVQPGELFFALKGEKNDGHDFLGEAAQKGAVGAIVSKGYPGSVGGLVLLGVEDVQGSLEQLARHSIEEKPAPILGVTGSVGKTTTKEFLATLLEGKFRVGKSPASYNSRVTFPLNLLNRTGDEQVLVLEMGMSMPGEIAKLVEIAAPDIAVLTKVALSHAMNFPDGLAGIARAKGEIFSQTKTKTAILDLECLQYPDMVSSIQAEKVTFSTQDAAADYFLSFAEGRYRMDERGVRAFEFDLPFKAGHLLHNFTAAVAAARQMGMQWEEIERQIPRLHLPKMRFEQFEKSGVWFINDAYNANPASMRAALENLPEPKEGGKRIAVLATMKELGSFSKEAHEEIGRLAQKRIDVLLCLGEEAAPLCETYRESMKPAELYYEHQTLAEKLNEIMRPGDVVLMKGSRSMQLEKLLEMIHVAAPC